MLQKHPARAPRGAGGRRLTAPPGEGVGVVPALNRWSQGPTPHRAHVTPTDVGHHLSQATVPSVCSSLGHPLGPLFRGLSAGSFKSCSVWRRVKVSSGCVRPTICTVGRRPEQLYAHGLVGVRCDLAITCAYRRRVPEAVGRTGRTGTMTFQHAFARVLHRGGSPFLCHHCCCQTWLPESTLRDGSPRIQRKRVAPYSAIFRPQCSSKAVFRICTFSPLLEMYHPNPLFSTTTCTTYSEKTIFFFTSSVLPSWHQGSARGKAVRTAVLHQIVNPTLSAARNSTRKRTCLDILHHSSRMNGCTATLGRSFPSCGRKRCAVLSGCRV